MATTITCPGDNRASFHLLLLFPLLALVLLSPPATPLSFNFSTFDPARTSRSKECPQQENLICLLEDASANDGAIELTKRDPAEFRGDLSVGRAAYSMPLLLWDKSSRALTNFSTEFSFIIDSLGKNQSGDGIAFFLAQYPPQVPEKSAGGQLGLVSAWNSYNASGDSGFVAIELDSYRNDDWEPSFYHLGIDVNSIRSVRYVNMSDPFAGNVTGNVRVAYDSGTHNLSAFLSYRGRSYSVSYTIDLRDFLPDRVSVGFTATTGLQTQLNIVHSWIFQSSLVERKRKKKKKEVIGIIVGILAGVGLAICGASLVWFVLWRKRGRKDAEMGTSDGVYGDAIDEEFESEQGARKFPYSALVAATGNFSEERKLGVGGFGAVYRGHLRDSKLDVAVKRISKDSKQGRKEYMSEVKIISRLRHRNLVQLVGWCHESDDLLLVYEFMPNRSLDTHLFGADKALPWPARYNIAVGLASSLLYLHEEWEQCVVHRDVKSSNVMLDAAFNTKLGDFGLARLVDHGSGMQTTFLAGTVGYLAPECFMARKGSKEADVYSFGVVALEICTGKRATGFNAEEDVPLVEWVWNLYGRGRMVEAADKRLEMEFDLLQMERLMMVGLWCAHPDFNLRPSIRQAMSFLKFEATIPDLPSKMPPTILKPYSSTLVTSSLSSTALTPQSGDRYSDTASPLCASSADLSLLHPVTAK